MTLGSREKIYVNRNSIFYNGSCGKCRELAIRFVGCNFRCSFCYAWKYSWPPDYSSLNENYIKELSVENILKELTEYTYNKNFKWIRITGGETIWNNSRVSYLIDILNELNLSEDYHIPKKIIIQTNGSFISDLFNKLTTLNEFDSLNIIIEVSIKGTNVKEFELLNEPFKNNSVINNSLFYKQIEGYWKLKDLFNKSRNIYLCARLGIGHHRHSITFIYPETYQDTIPQIMFHDSKWSKEFEDVYKNEIQTHGYFAVEDINVNEGGLGSIIHLYVPAIVRMLNRKIIIDRSNKINEYGYFKHEISNGKVTPFPKLTEYQVENLIKQYNEYRKTFKFTPSQKYLSEFNSLT